MDERSPGATSTRSGAARPVGAMTGEPAVRWLHLPVETKARELEARILLACVASERGFGSVIGRKGEVAKMADRLPRGVYIEKSAQRVMQRGVETRNRLGHVECCLDEEGVVYINAADYTEGRLARPVLDRFHRFFAWGGDQAEVVSSYHPPLADRIRITGNPRVDFWRPELRSLHAGSTESLRDEIGPFVLFTTAFAMVNNSRGDEYFVDTLRSNGRLETAEGAKQVEGYIAHSRRIFDEMLTAVRKLGEARPDLRVVVRPHPSEDITTWESAVEGLGNVSVRREGAVTPWLLAADAVIHNNSTTGLEATLLGRPTIAFVPYADERYDQNLPNAVSRPAASVSELIDLIDAVNGPGGLDPTEANVEALSGHIAALDGPLASERMMDEIERIGPPPSPLSAGPGRRIRSQLQLGGLRLARKLGRLGPAVSDPVITKAEPVRAEKYPPTPVDEVVRFVERLQEATGRFAGVRCARLADQIYTILPPGR